MHVASNSRNLAFIIYYSVDEASVERFSLTRFLSWNSSTVRVSNDSLRSFVRPPVSALIFLFSCFFSPFLFLSSFFFFLSNKRGGRGRGGCPVRAPRRKIGMMIPSGTDDAISPLHPQSFPPRLIACIHAWRLAFAQVNANAKGTNKRAIQI